MKIVDVFKLRPQKGDVGLEIEVEGRNLQQVFNDNWVSKADPSLKSGYEGIEYVMTAPKSLDGVEKALRDLKLSLKKSEIISTIYAGIHTHVNVQELTTRQLVNYVCAFIILEDLLVDWCGDTRVGNHFCLRSSDAEGMIQHIREMIIQENIKLSHTDVIRYSSCNLKSLQMYGSLEFRTLESTMDIERIMTWCEVLVNIRNMSKRYASPDQMILSISKEGQHLFVTEMLGPHTHKFLKAGWQNAIREGVYRAQDIAFCKNWNDVNYNIFRAAKGVF